jgi:Berberine and berberine like
VCGVMWCHTGTLEEAEKALKPIRAARKPALDWVGPMPYPAVQSMFDPFYPAGMQWYWNADFVGELSDKAIEIHAKYGAKSPSILSAMHLYPVDGAAGRVSPTETPWSYREAKWGQVIAGIDPDPKNRDAITTWSKSYWKELHPHSLGGAYINMMMEEGEDRIRATYRGNYDRLAAIKRKFDPANFFNVNQNIKPAGVTKQA